MYRKNSVDLTEEYDFNENIIVNAPKCEMSMRKCSKKSKNGKVRPQKVSDDNFFIPETSQYDFINIYNFNVKQLKDICKHYKQKQSGNKNEVKKRMYNYLKETHHALKIQTNARKYLYKKYLTVKGGKCFSRDKCINETDFITLQKLSDIEYYSFFSYTSNDTCYGFHISSINTYLNDVNSKNCNPYDRKKISNRVRQNIKSFINLSKIFNYPICLEIKDEEVIFNDNDIIRNKTVELFQIMDSLGHYTNPNWFLSLDVRRVLKYIRELHDIWDYRAQLTAETKRSIHYPNGTPFHPLYNNLNPNNRTHNLNVLRKTALQIIENLITKGINDEFKSLGCLYVLAGFTLVNSEAAEAIPWLFDSVIYSTS